MTRDSLDRVFTSTEVPLVERLFAFADLDVDRARDDLRVALERGVASLGAIATAIETYPSLRDVHTLAERTRTEQTLIEALREGKLHGLEWSLPTKAVLSRAFGIAKVNFWISIVYSLRAIGGAEVQELAGLVQDSVEEAVYTRLAEELYVALAISRDRPPEIRQAAINHVIDVWEGRVNFATYHFCPILRSAWAARARTRCIFGTLMGATEILDLLFQECPAEFLDVFTRRGEDIEMFQAFEEFLFDLTWEEIEHVRECMVRERKDSVGRVDVARYLAFPPDELRERMDDPRRLYTSFRKRRIRARHRDSMNLRGPKRTAESYVLEALLRAELVRAADREASKAR